MARFPTLGPGDKVRDKHLPDRLAKNALDSSYAPVPEDDGTDGQVLVKSGAGTAWATVSGGGSGYDGGQL